jgi:hypothetical protein
MKQELNSSCNEGMLQCRLELVYGHAWGGGGTRQSPAEFRVDVASVARRPR